MDSEFGLVGSGWQDYHDQQIQPLLDQYNQQMNDILANGAHGAIAQMQMEDDAGGAGSGGGGSDAGAGIKTLITDSSGGGGQAASLPTGYGDAASFHPAHLDVGPDAPASPVLAGAAQLGDLAYPQTVNLQSAGGLDATKFFAKEAGSTVATGPTLEDAARSAPFNMKDADLAAAWRQADTPLYVEQGARHVLPSLIASGLPQPLKTILTLPTKFVNQLLDESEPQRREEAYHAELFRRMNDTMAQSATSQSAPPAMRGFFMK